MNDTKIWNAVPTLRGNHVLLRPMADVDRDGLLTMAADVEAWDNFYLTAPTSSSVDKWLEDDAEDQKWRRSMPFTACQPNDGRIIGTTQYLRMNEKHRRLEIGATFFAASVRQSGVNTESKRLLLGHAFDVLKCNAVQIRTDVLHHRSRFAIERLGARYDGLLRRHSIMPNGRIRDLFVYSFIADEWPGISQHLDHLLASHKNTKTSAF